MKKKINTSLLLSFLIAFSISAQSYEYDLPKDCNCLKIDDISGKITIKGHSKNELKIEAKGLKSPPKEAEGLKALKRSGIDNTGLNLNLSMIDEVLHISGGSMRNNFFEWSNYNALGVEKSAGTKEEKTEEKQKAEYTIYMPEHLDLIFSSNRFWFRNSLDKESMNSVEISGISGEIEISLTGSHLVLDEITGPVVASVQHGDIHIVFDEVSQKSPMSVLSANGNIDISIPAKTKASFKLGATFGEIYTNLDIKPQIIEEESPIPSGVLKKGTQGLYFEYTDSLLINKNEDIKDFMKRAKLQGNYFSKADNFDFKGNLNGGGVEISVKNNNGNIYLRKK